MGRKIEAVVGGVEHPIEYGRVFSREISPVLITPDATSYAYTYGFLSTLYVVTGAR